MPETLRRAMCCGRRWRSYACKRKGSGDLFGSRGDFCADYTAFHLDFKRIFDRPR